MKILHVCSDYSKQKIYQKFISALSDFTDSQIVYVPVRSEEELNRNPVSSSNVKIYYSNILRKFHRVLFRSKIRRVFKDLNEKIDVGSVDLIHAHFLYSDGAVALKAYKKYGIPYVVAVRNTDINMFMKFRPDLKLLAIDILRKASAVVVLTPSYKQILIDFSPSSERVRLSKKVLVLPNGVDEYWLKNINISKSTKENTIRILYVGDLSANKNINSVLQAIDMLSSDLNIEYTVVGSGGGKGERQFLNVVSKNKYSFLHYVGRVDNKEKLLPIYRCNDIFVMPSFKETFGVSYIEALSQGLPIIFSKGQAVDGYFDHTNVGVAVDPRDVNDIAYKIKLVCQDLEARKLGCTAEAERFSWGPVVHKYVDVYNRIRNKTD